MDSCVDTLDFVWLEITYKCPLACEHCYNESGPTGTHGTMTTDDWLRVMRELRELGARHVQFIGGEPMLHPDLALLIDEALAEGLEVEVFTNLVHVPAHLWAKLGQPGVKVATSAYSDDPEEHDSITCGPKSHGRTMANIARVLERQIPLRVGLIEVRDGQRVEQARAYLENLGVDPNSIGCDRLRQVGRGEREQTADATQLCGWCTNANLAILPDGTVTPCVFSRWLEIGNVLTDSLRTIYESPKRRDVDAELDACFAKREPSDNCGPTCNPAAPAPCNPRWLQDAGTQDSNSDPTDCWPDRGGCGPCRPYAPARWTPPELAAVSSSSCPPSCNPGCNPSYCSPPRQPTDSCYPSGTCGPGYGCSPNCAPSSSCRPR